MREEAEARLRRLIEVLDERRVPEADRAGYVCRQMGGQPRISFFSDLFRKNKSSGDKLARKIEAKLGLVDMALEPLPVSASALELGVLFDQLPPAGRRVVYATAQALLSPEDDEPTAPAPAPGPSPTPRPEPHR